MDWKFTPFSKKGMGNPELMEKVFKPFESTVTKGMTKEEKIDYLCLMEKFEREEISELGELTIELYNMAVNIILNDRKFTDSLSEEEAKRIKGALIQYVKTGKEDKEKEDDGYAR